MKIQKVFTEIDTSEKMYSVLMTEEELRLFSGDPFERYRKEVNKTPNYNPANYRGMTRQYISRGKDGRNYDVFEYSNGTQKRFVIDPNREKYLDRLLQEAIKQSMKEQRKYSLVLTEEEMRCFGLLGWIDRKVTGFKNGLNNFRAKVRKGFINLLGLGKTRYGQAAKNRIEAENEILNMKNNADYNYRQDLLNY